MTMKPGTQVRVDLSWHPSLASDPVNGRTGVVLGTVDTGRLTGARRLPPLIRVALDTGEVQQMRLDWIEPVV